MAMDWTPLQDAKILPAFMSFMGLVYNPYRWLKNNWFSWGEIITPESGVINLLVLMNGRGPPSRIHLMIVLPGTL